MKILITGASGFIGGFLVEEALRRGGVREIQERELKERKIELKARRPRKRP